MQWRPAFVTPPDLQRPGLPCATGSRSGPAESEQLAADLGVLPDGIGTDRDVARVAPFVARADLQARTLDHERGTSEKRSGVTSCARSTSRNWRLATDSGGDTKTSVLGHLHGLPNDPVNLSGGVLAVLHRYNLARELHLRLDVEIQ
jgi:hypothetical protein